MPGISIKNILNKNGIAEEKEKEAVSETNAAAEENIDFTQNDLTRYWKEYIDSIPGKKLLATTMQSCIPTLEDNFNIKILVDNPIQEKEVLAERSELTSFLSKKLHNHKIYLYVAKAEYGENKKALTPRERYNAMLERNPLIDRLRSELGLELD